jgi:hypothetical protein
VREEAYAMTAHRTPRILAVIVALVSLSLQGCALNSVREIQPKDLARKKPSTRIVIGVGSEKEFLETPVSVVVERYDPATKKGGDCYHWDRAVADAPAMDGKIEYRVFEVPAGVYTYSFANLPVLTNPAAFVVNEGKTAYIGDYILTAESDRFKREIVRLRSNLTAAKAALGPAAETVELAPTLPNAPRPLGFICTP